MNNKKNETENIFSKKGSAIAYGLIIVAIVSIILTSMITFVVSQLKNGYYVQSKEQAFQIAESGINYYRWYLAHETDGRTAQQIKNFWQNGNPIGVDSPYVAVFQDASGNAVGEYSVSVAPPDVDSTIIQVTSVGYTYKYPGTKRTIKVRLRRPSWSEYAALTNNFSRFGDGTEVNGKIFSNGGVHFDGVANNVVYSGVSSYYDSDSDVKATKPGVWTSWSGEYNSNMGSNVFTVGKDYPMPVKDFNSVSADLSLMKSEAQAGTNGSLYFDNSKAGRHIVLNADGTFQIRTVKNYNGSTNEINQYSGGWSTYNIPNDGLIFVENNVWVEGTINNKRVTIVAANLISGVSANVFISKDISYTNFDGSDILGLIAQNDVEITKNSENYLTIDAALLAQEGRVGREYYSTGCGCSNSCEDHKDTITIFGSIATNQRYGFAWMDSCPRDTGYTNRILDYDNNLLYYPPPYFPTGDKYLIDLWEEL